jgi:transcriptional regulator with XRE-family HTH domain
MNVGTKIKSYLEEKGISQAFVSSKSGIPPAKLNLALNGKRKLSLSEYESVCWALGVGVSTFMEPRPPVT